MWKWLHPYAHPERAYHLAGAMLPWFAALATLLIATGTIWGLGFAPVDYQQGDSYRIIFLHVPAASMSMAAYTAMAICAFIGLVWQLKLADIAAAAIAPVGAVLTFIALLTGAAWGKPMWGTWWVWDARLTSELVLLFLYLGVIALYASFEDKVMAAKAAGILAIVGVINLPIIKYSVEWWNTLHQPNAITVGQSNNMPPEMLIPLLCNIFGFAVLIGALSILRFRAEVLARNSMRPWVRAMVEAEEKKSA
ncbi:heme exporter protein CcmC [Ferrimonas balearica DSM 9799]|uniref:Heme exporter protein C n=1 Tax=Ferrimonas balearica (strain DSM 9799 / CCM 4581 / KCTC 23876 / PAT) TaxID=550540 RepID=E1SMF7_FERBD|nr:heme ABC transporter permease [Ferrimonas balearica]MBY6019884.1 heme ABC transporter permease [Halomonas denitrificans]ADN74512.1 heme exporter protein CcmC [Ferrimonas balearica DSM 9799]MBW3141661.1 heme ABC transporter permease [Ferrimonas balearica]MBW3166655.1 heme ABC transporter permease [Ferrimonas balearica]MBY5982393.1 heme ABC transporter permease [Ferrimonas balearica]